MFRPPERRAAINAYHFKQPVAIQKTAVEHRNHRLRFGNKPAVEKNNHGINCADYLHREKAKQAIPGRSWAAEPVAAAAVEETVAVTAAAARPDAPNPPATAGCG